MTAQSLTVDDIEASIREERYFTAAEGAVGAAFMAAKAAGESTFQAAFPTRMNVLTFCVLTLDNGFLVVGYSAPVGDTFDAEIGRKIARGKAIDQVWPLVGYELRSKIADTEAAALPTP